MPRFSKSVCSRRLRPCPNNVHRCISHKGHMPRLPTSTRPRCPCRCHTGASSWCNSHERPMPRLSKSARSHRLWSCPVDAPIWCIIREGPMLRLPTSTRLRRPPAMFYRRTKVLHHSRRAPATALFISTPMPPLAVYYR